MTFPMVCLVIRDGWGWGMPGPGNAILNARTPHTDYFQSTYPSSLIKTSGLSVGLPAGYQGNSEVGHLNIGAGRVVYQSLTRIDRSIESGDFFSNTAITDAVISARKKKSRLHLMGLIQEEGVHAVTRHCLAILKICKKLDFHDVLIHAITDGRDTPPRSAQSHMNFLQQGISEIGIGRVVTVSGRYYAMDRDSRWDRTRLAYDCLVNGKGQNVQSWQDAIKQAYAEGQSDEFITPRQINYRGMKSDDSVIFFNFRFDRTRQLTRAMVEEDFSEFATTRLNLHFVAMTHYYDNGRFQEAFPEIANKNILGEILSREGIPQLRCAETEKFAHVTFFFNGLRNHPFPLEERILVPSPKVATYDLQPEMSAFSVRDKLVQAVNSEKFPAIVCNFANGDMVGHTGIYPSIIKAVETVDTCVNDVVRAVLAKKGACILTADHGNAEQTVLEDGSPMTAHTINPVPLTLVAHNAPPVKLNGSLCDIAPTFLELLGLKKPADMTGRSLIYKKSKETRQNE